jgi:hydrogenase maturation protein HypF
MAENLAKLITVSGLIQGVGFRPFVYRLAHKYSINGWVKNTNESVIIHAEGASDHLNLFISELTKSKPDAAILKNIAISESSLEFHTKFGINLSESVSNNITFVSPDIAICNDCLKDIHNQPLRLNYQLTNCCNCGPRFSIIKDLPYDRSNTSMAPFKMCHNCKAEYTDISNRRFHAQPISCNNCGPTYQLHLKNENISSIEKIICYISSSIENGEIFAIKGTGGFHLACDALNENAVARLRQIKHRDTKPFAVMFRNFATARLYVNISEVEENELLSYKRPILILKEITPLAASVTLKLGTIGVMLPYMAFHYSLFEHMKCEVLVMTSANISDEPVIIDNQVAVEKFIHCTDGIITYNRDIVNRTDDSVVLVANDVPRIIRRSRGFVPEPLTLPFETEGIFAAGAELTGTFAIGKGKEIIASQYFGDLQNAENFNFYKESFQQFSELFRFQPQTVVCDLHPDYVTTVFARNLNLPVEQVQHHHAHIASVMAEHNIEAPLIGVAFDGTGYGTDGNIWGSEFLLCDGIKFERLSHFQYIPLPGGDKAVLEPWRSGTSYLYKCFGPDLLQLEIPFIKNLEANKIKLVLQAIDKKINTPLSCSAGRLFDAFAAISGICLNPTFYAEAPMRLESVIDWNCKETYSFTLHDNIISFDSMWQEVVQDIKENKPKEILSAKFHNTIIQVIFKTCKYLRNQTGINIIALSGGTFQNKYLIEKTEKLLSENMFTVISNRQFPSNDGGIAIGQMYIAAKKENYVFSSTSQS